jgi:hypothetical protein
MEEETGTGARFRDRRLLIAVSIGLPLGEVVALSALGIPSGVGLAGQATALGPFGVFHDLRWLFVFHASVLSFALGLVALLVLRALLLTVLVRLAWPGSPPSWRSVFGGAFAATGAAVILLSPWVTLLFGAALLPLSWVFFAAVPPALATIVVLHHGGIDRDWWRRLPPARSAAWIGLSFVALSLAALAASGQPAALAFPATAVAGLFNAWAWHRSVRAIVTGLPMRRRNLVPTTGMAAVAILAVVVGGAQIGFAAHGAEDPGGPGPGDVDGGEKAVLLVAGFASGCCDDAVGFQGSSPDLLIEQFSYVGLDPSGRPLAHPGGATDADLDRLSQLMSVQVEALHRRSGGAVAIVAESEGTLAAEEFLFDYPDAPVDRLMLLSPIVDPVRVTYPDIGREGRGVVAGYQLRVMTSLIESMAPFQFSLDGPLADSLQREAASLRGVWACTSPRIEEIAVLPLADAVTGMSNGEYGIDVVVVPGFHGGLRGRLDVQKMIETWVTGGELAASDLWIALDRVIAGAASAWRMPSLDRYWEPHSLEPGGTCGSA